MSAQGWNFPQNGSMPRYMNDSRYAFSLTSNPITSLDAAAGVARQARQGPLALTDNFAHISNEMDA